MKGLASRSIPIGLLGPLPCIESGKHAQSATTAIDDLTGIRDLTSSHISIGINWVRPHIDVHSHIDSRNWSTGEVFFKTIYGPAWGGFSQIWVIDLDCSHFQASKAFRNLERVRCRPARIKSAEGAML
jgi:hypothetical protein